GILGLASVQAKQSGASRTSPVLRGNWVVETLLGEKLPRPPPNVPKLPEEEGAERLTTRQQVERHAKDKACAVCHVRIDPFGFALEKYDAIGRLRDKDLGGLAVDFALAMPATAAPPNVVMIIGDDQGWRDYGFMGHERIKTPHLDKLASEGMVFKRGYVPSSLCRASLASMITGLYPHQHGITSNDPPLPKGMTLAQAANDPAFLKLRQDMAAYIEKVPTLPRLL